MCPLADGPGLSLRGALHREAFSGGRRLAFATDTRALAMGLIEDCRTGIVIFKSLVPLVSKFS